MLKNLIIQSKVLKVLSLILTITGMIFILASKYIGPAAIRLSMILLLLFSIINFKMTYKYLSLKEKTTSLLAVLSSLLGIYKPELTMIILGVFILYLALPIYIKSIKNKDYSDFITLIISGTGILFALLCILNSKAALQTIIIIIGMALTILGCLFSYQILVAKKLNSYYEDDNFKFDKTNDI